MLGSPDCGLLSHIVFLPLGPKVAHNLASQVGFGVLGSGSTLPAASLRLGRLSYRPSETPPLNHTVQEFDWISAIRPYESHEIVKESRNNPGPVPHVNPYGTPTFHVMFISFCFSIIP